VTDYSNYGKGTSRYQSTSVYSRRLQ